MPDSRPDDRGVLRRRLARAAFVALVAAGPLALAMLAGACILADPPAKVSDPPPRRLRILRESAAPPVSEILRAWPGTFHILVEVDPGASFTGYGFLDYDAVNRMPAQDVAAIRDLVDVDDAGERVVDVTFVSPDTTRCHTVEVLLSTGAFTFDRTPDPSTSDSIVWFYSPTGDITACAAFDGGIQLTDAASDAPADARRGD